MSISEATDPDSCVWDIGVVRCPNGAEEEEERREEHSRGRHGCVEESKQGPDRERTGSRRRRRGGWIGDEVGKIARWCSGELETDGVPSGRLEIVLRPRSTGRLSELCPARQVECLSVQDQSAAATAISAENISPVLTATARAHAASHARRTAARPPPAVATPPRRQI